MNRIENIHKKSLIKPLQKWRAFSYFHTSSKKKLESVFGMLERHANQRKKAELLKNLRENTLKTKMQEARIEGLYFKISLFTNTILSIRKQKELHNLSTGFHSLCFHTCSSSLSASHPTQLFIPTHTNPSFLHQSSHLHSILHRLYKYSSFQLSLSFNKLDQIIHSPFKTKYFNKWKQNASFEKQHMLRFKQKTHIKRFRNICRSLTRRTNFKKGLSKMGSLVAVNDGKWFFRIMRKKGKLQWKIRKALLRILILRRRILRKFGFQKWKKYLNTNKIISRFFNLSEIKAVKRFELLAYLVIRNTWHKSKEESLLDALHNTKQYYAIKNCIRIRKTCQTNCQFRR